jgi:hypothetical protein
MPGYSVTPAPVSGFGAVDATNVQGLGSKYRVGFGEPYDLAAVGLDYVTHVRLVDIEGDGSAQDSAGNAIYDPSPVFQSAGFDLEAIGATQFSVWRSFQASVFLAGDVNATALAHLPDGRFVLGIGGRLRVQSQWGGATTAAVPANGVVFDPAFLAVKDGSTALLGAGGFFTSTLHRWQPAAGVQPALSAVLQNFSAAYWKSPTSALEGWLIGGTNAPDGTHNVSFVSLDGSVSGPVTQSLCTYSGGLAVDAQGHLYTALYELDGTPKAADADRVLRFSAAQVQTAVQAILASAPAPLPRSAGAFVHRFSSTSSLAVDAAGRVWAAGFKVAQLEVFDPATSVAAIVHPDHPAFAPGIERSFQVATYPRDGAGYVAFVVRDLFGGAGTPVFYGEAPISAFAPPPYAVWRAQRFGVANLTPASESTLWGTSADPDFDGRSNLAEYALHTDPLAATGSDAITTTRQGGLLAISFLRDPLHTDLTYFVEASSTLAASGWTTLASSTHGAPTIASSASNVVETVEGALQRVVVADQASAAGAARRFLRVRFTLSPP